MKCLFTFDYTKTENTMTTITNATGTKAVNITYNSFNGFRASFVQVYKNDQDVIEAKSFTTEKKAISWANKKLN